MVERPTAEALQQLRDTLPLWSEQKPLPTGWQDYCRYYGIDFSDRFAQADYRAGAVESGPYRLAVNRWQLPGATRNLVLLHGYTDHSGLFGHLIAYGLATNCNVLIFDLPGHGLSTGEPAAIDTFSEYAVALADVLQAVALPQLPTWTMAQSTGCSVLMEYARHYDWPFRRQCCWRHCCVPLAGRNCDWPVGYSNRLYLAFPEPLTAIPPIRPSWTLSGRTRCSRRAFH